MGKRERREEGSGQGIQSGPQAPQAQSEGSDRPLLQALHRLVGNQGVEALEQAGAADSMSLYLRHLSQVSEGLQVDTSAYMPDVAPQSWMREIVPLYDVLSRDRALLMEQRDLDEAASVHADTSSSTAQTDASVVAPVSRLASGMNVIDDDVDAVADFEKLMGQAGMGRALSDQEQAFLTRVHGRAFPEIRVHEGGASDKAAQQIHAKAFARDSDIYVAGRIDVDTAQGAELLAHEATHVVQAEEGRLPQATGGGLQVSDPSQSHEREADQIGKQAAQTVREDGGDDPWGLGRVPIFDSTGQAIVDQLGQVLPDPASLSADHRSALESTLAEGRDHSEPADLMAELAGDLLSTEDAAATSPGTEGVASKADGGALHRVDEGGNKDKSEDKDSVLDQVHKALEAVDGPRALKMIGQVREPVEADQILDDLLEEAVDALENAEVIEASQCLVRRGGRLARALEWQLRVGADPQAVLDLIESCNSDEYLTEVRTQVWREQLAPLFSDDSEQVARLEELLGEKTRRKPRR